MGRTVKAWLAAMVLLVAAAPAWSGDAETSDIPDWLIAPGFKRWPKRGFFSVQSSILHDGRKACEIFFSPMKEATPFIAWVDIAAPSHLVVTYASDDRSIAQAEEVEISIGSVEMLTFTPVSREIKPNDIWLLGVLGQEEAARSWEAMWLFVGEPTWLTVVAGDGVASFPAKGLDEMLVDFAECRQQRSL